MSELSRPSIRVLNIEDNVNPVWRAATDWRPKRIRKSAQYSRELVLPPLDLLDSSLLGLGFPEAF
jgi:hypothetical protein